MAPLRHFPDRRLPDEDEEDEDASHHVQAADDAEKDLERFSET